ncbi:HAD family hydrolase [Paenibacillus sp. J2TS4]|uniref:HAD family hydrolase n=1 Tax=Paenibacillus sp. J2TS4 TaxID=2807194 RepID=UPI001B1D8A0B|nr:HAD family hydrolase [Paenibacillus sp. J2TS4]GIP33237.1 haloacid dehalogenase [Paenibacillus sp. J2TS4]
MKNIRLIVSDLDGTLLSPDHQITDSVWRAVRAFTEAGGWFTIATGRTGVSVRQTVERLNIDLPMILCNGSILADKGKIWEQAELSTGGLIPYLQEADRQGLSAVVFQESGLSAISRTQDIARFEQRENVDCRLADLTEEQWAVGHAHKVLIIGDMNKALTLWEAYSPDLPNAYSTVQSEVDFFEILPANQSKGRALIQLTNLLGIELSEVMAIGNQMNDLDMLEQAGIGVAVANSHPELAAKADYVCSGSFGEGVVEAMKVFCADRMKGYEEE